MSAGKNKDLGYATLVKGKTKWLASKILVASSRREA